MKARITLLITLLTLEACILNGQTGPGGIGNTSGISALQLWLIADSSNIKTTMTAVDTLFDMSGAGNHLYSTGSTRPSLITGALNGQPVIQFTGSQYMEAPGVNTSFNGV